MVNCPGAKVVINGLRKADHRNPFRFKQPLGRAIGIIAANGNQYIDFIAFKILQHLWNPALRIFL